MCLNEFTWTAFHSANFLGFSFLLFLLSERYLAPTWTFLSTYKSNQIWEVSSVGRKKSDQKPATIRKIRPALTPEARENQMISLAMDLAEKQLLEGTASSQVITHFLKLGSLREQKELAILEEQRKLTEAKTEKLQSESTMDELYLNAINAMKRYSGYQGSDEE